MHPNIGDFWPIFKRCMTSPPPSRWENRFGYFDFYFVLYVGIFFPAKDGMSKPGLTCGWKEDEGGDGRTEWKGMEGNGPGYGLKGMEKRVWTQRNGRTWLGMKWWGVDGNGVGTETADRRKWAGGHERFYSVPSS